MKKLSFSISQSSKSSVSIRNKPSKTFDDNDPQIASDDPRNYVTEFNAGEASAGSLPAKAVTVAPLENSWDWRRLKKMKNLDLPVSARSEGLQFEAEVPPGAEESNVSYGLNLRNQSAVEGEEEEEEEEGKKKKTTTNNGGIGAGEDLRRLKVDLEALPEDRGMEEFEGMAVEDFGKAVLAGYGWKEGQGVGRNAKADVVVFEQTKRTDKRGIGFIDLPESSNRKHGKKKDEVLGREARATGSREARRGETSSSAAAAAEKEKEKEKKKKRKMNEEVEASWVVSGIRVKVISKRVRGGGLYLKKGEVVDVVGPGVCDVAMDGGREVIQGVSQEALETVVPRQGGRVLVLSGRRRGVFGCLVERDSERERGVVKDADTHEHINVRFDQVAEFVGDPSELGY